VRVWSALATAGKVMDTGVALPALSVTVAVAVAAAPAAVGVPLMAPVVSLISSPAGSPVASYESMSPLGLVGPKAAMVSPTFNDAGAV
jgi:hypothetical protein